MENFNITVNVVT